MKSDLHISSEISAYEQALESINELKKKVRDGKEELVASYKGVIEAKSVFEGIKKQNIEEIRQYKFAIAAECKEISAQVSAIKVISEAAQASELRSFVESCERLNILSQSGFFSRFKID